MRAYVMVTGAAFTLLTLVHVWRFTVERHTITEPIFVLVTAVSAAFAAWAFGLLRSRQRS